MPSSTQSSPFIKELASSDRRTREHALDSLRSYLQRSTPFTELEFLKLWKGLFFCMWMSDKPLTQQRLARDLADLTDVLNGPDNFITFVRAFWKTIAREWSGIEALRMDKFLYLVRCYVGKGFERVARQQWAGEELLERYLSVLEDVPLNVRDGKIPNGLRFHVIDIYVDELDKADIERDVPLEKVLAPLKKLGEETVTKAIRVRVREALENEKLQDWQGKSASGRVDSNGDGVNGAPTGAVQSAEDDEFEGFED